MFVEKQPKGGPDLRTCLQCGYWERADGDRGRPRWEDLADWDEEEDGV